MKNNESETLSEQRKARKEFLELKKMQNGEIAPPPKPSEEEVVPKTFGQKLLNFWFHYKTTFLLSVFLCIVMIISVSQCVSRPVYDLKVLLYTENYYTDAQINVFKNYINQFCEDFNGDGKTVVQIINCSYTTKKAYDSEYVSALAAKMQATIAEEGDVLLFIVDREKKTHLNSISDKYTSFFVDETPVGSSLYSLASSVGQSLPKNLIIGRRIVEGTTVENDKNIDKSILKAKKIFDKIREEQPK